MSTKYITGITGIKFYLDGKQIDGSADFKFNTPPKENARKYTFADKRETTATISGIKWFPEELGKYYYLMKYGNTWRVRKKNKKMYNKKLGKLLASKLLVEMFGL